MPNPAPRHPVSRKLLAPLLLAALAGCATERPRSGEPIERYQLIAELADGRLRLTCETSCAGSWRLARSTVRGLYQNKVWQELAIAVAHVGYNSDLSYFYLGRAAEETGSPKAAELYFKLALATASKCRGLVFDSCDGIKLPAEASAGLARVAGK